MIGRGGEFHRLWGVCAVAANDSLAPCGCLPAGQPSLSPSPSNYTLDNTTPCHGRLVAIGPAYAHRDPSPRPSPFPSFFPSLLAPSDHLHPPPSLCLVAIDTTVVA